MYLCAKPLWCSSIKVAAHVELLPQSLVVRNQQLSVISPWYEEGCFAGVVGYCTAQDGWTSVETRIFPHFPAAGSDPVYLLSACCFLLFCTGLGSRFCSGLGKWSFDLQMRKEEGSRSEAEETGRETACWIMLIKLCSAMENPFYFLVQSTRQLRAFL